MAAVITVQGQGVSEADLIADRASSWDGSTADLIAGREAQQLVARVVAVRLNAKQQPYDCTDSSALGGLPWHGLIIEISSRSRRPTASGNQKATTMALIARCGRVVGAPSRDEPV
jgi:hypothetical protein